MRVCDSCREEIRWPDGVDDLVWSPCCGAPVLDTIQADGPFIWFPVRFALEALRRKGVVVGGG